MSPLAATAPWPRDTKYICWYCHELFWSYPELETIPPGMLPEKPALLRRLATCGKGECARKEDLRLDACCNAILRGEKVAR